MFNQRLAAFQTIANVLHGPQDSNLLESIALLCFFSEGDLLSLFSSIAIVTRFAKLEVYFFVCYQGLFCSNEFLK